MTLFSSMDPVTGSAQLSVSLNEGKVSTTHFESGLSSSDTYHDNLWHHYAVTCDNSTLTLYVDAEEVGTQSVSAGIDGVSELVIARNESGANYFTGLLDEIRIWSTVRTSEQVSGTMNQSLEGDNFGLTHYWRINDGTGNLTTDEVGQITGTITGATEEEVESMWSKDIPLNEFFDHWFEPESRLATLNQSNTSIDQVDYTDESLIPVSGYVKFENTACFLQGVEILINGESLIPSLHSESDGKFTVEIEPGATGQIISCYYKTPGTGAGEFPEELHEFLPPLIELPMMVQPISGLYFSDKTTRTVDGKVAGGTCEHSINPSQGQIEVNIQSTDGCFEVSLVPNENNGAYEFSDFPPLTYNVSIDHPNPTIDDFFMAEVIDLEKEDFTKDFIYRASLEVEFGDLYRLNFQTKERSELVDTGECETGYTPVNYYTHYQLEYNVFETYGENTCKVDTFNITISDQVSGQNYSYVSTDTEEGLFGDWYMDIFPLTVNLLDGGAHPYQSGINILAENIYGSSEVYSKWLLVTGTVQIPESNFQTDSESHPWFILRVPPGDGSSTYYESGTEKCEYSSYEFVDDEGGSASATLNLGGDVTMNMGMPGATTEIEASNTYDIGAGFEYNNSFTNAGEEETCITVTETYTAFGDGLLTGDDATVFVGGGESFSFGLVKELVYDECEVSIDTTISIDNEGVASTYVHSKYYIVNVMIPNALMLYQLGDEASYDIWQNWLEAIAYDSTLIAESSSDAAFAVGQVVDGDEQEPTGDTYLSFDAGATVEYSYSTSVMTSSTHGYSEDFTETIFLEVGISLNGFGVSGSAGATLNQNSSTTNTDGNTSSTSVGFVLDDDDPGDGFLVQIKKDEKNMPVFFTAGGQSSCPWEQNTVRRELAVLSAEQSFVHDVPPDESAVFTLLLGNASETGESNYYELAAEMTTLNGAAITANGQSLGGGGQVFWLNAGEQAPVIVEVSRGPIGYEFDDIALELHSPCEGDIAADLGANTQNAAGILLSVHFQEPCSETNIANLENGWVIDGSQVEDTLWVTVHNYNFPPDTFVTSIDLQYRRGGSGDWFTAYSVSNEDVIDEYLLMPFNISPNIIIDGAYELRAQAQCTGGKYPGTSQAVSGLIDRTAPLVLGLPEPVDGILGPDDLIRVSLNEDVLCGSINPGAGDIQLWNAVTGQPVDFEFTCGFNQVTIEPAPANTWLENQTFRAEIHSLEDMYGNVRAEAIVWEFFINRNPIEWSGTNIDNIVIFVDEEYSTSRTLANNGGSNRSWDIIGGREGAMPSGDPLTIPSWLEVSPMSGTLTPGASQDISISLALGLDFGSYSTTIYAAGTMGDEPMKIDIRKLCYAPVWSLNPSDFEFSMTITATLSTDGELSSDLYDIIGVFVGEELRGTGTLSFVEPLDDMGLHAYETFLTIYSNQQSGEGLSFRVWDASECTALGWIEESYAFEANAALGNLTSPATITATSQIITTLEYPQGWSWLSLNLTREDMSLNSIFGEINATSGDIIKSQTGYSQFVSGAAWIGSLLNLNNDEMYMLRISNESTVEMVGYAVDVELDTIAIVSGWNWIGYMPQSSLDVNWALNSLPSATGDLVKSQFAYAQYLEGYGWFGSLTFMNPKLGYMLKSLYPGQLTFPFFDQPPAAKEMAATGSTLAEDAPDWNVTPNDFEHSMNVTGSLYIHDEVSVDPLDMIAAFVDGDCRGVAQPVYYPALDKFLIFMTIYSNEAENEVIEFIAFNSDESSELYIPEQVDFQINAVYGNIEEPFEFNARYLAIGDPGYIPIVFSLAQNYPNPFNPVTTIGYGLPADASVELVMFNILGQEVARLVDEKKNAGFHFVSWNGTNDLGKPLAGGIYLYQIRAKNVSPASGQGFVKTHKLILLK